METNRRERYERPAYAHTSPADLLWLALGAIAVGALIYVLFWPQALNAPAPDYRPDVVRTQVIAPAAPVYVPAPTAQPVPAPAAPAPVVEPTPAPLPPRVITVIQRLDNQGRLVTQTMDGQGGQVITGSGACGAAGGARRCGR